MDKSDKIHTNVQKNLFLQMATNLFKSKLMVSASTAVLGENFTYDTSKNRESVGTCLKKFFA